MTLWFDVVAYGAAGDGTTDDRVAIQNAVNAAISAGGGTVYFPRGIYAIAKYMSQIPLIEVSNGQNLQFVGDGVGNSVLFRKAGTHSNDTHIVRITHGSNIGFRDITFDGNRANVTDADDQRHGIYIGGLSGAVSNG